MTTATLLGPDEQFHRVWPEYRGMPEFTNVDLEPDSSIRVHFASMADLDAFEAFVGQYIQRKQRTAAVWYPKMGVAGGADKRYVATERRDPTYPIYIVSKGRATNQMTSKALDRIGVPHYVVVEGEQLAEYEAGKHPLASMLVLDPAFKREYQQLTDEPGSTGPGPARNFAWEHSIGLGAKRHWVMDDNIWQFNRRNHNVRVPLWCGNGFTAMEEFCDRYTNVAMAGPNYFMFAVRKAVAAPFYLNTRIYSCNLILNSVPQRWRGRYNEDTILSLDMLKAGWCTIQFNAFLQYKMVTQTQKGGNTAEFYAREGTAKKSQMLVDTHPDVSRLAKRFRDANGEKRDHHVVDYKPFWRANHLELRPDAIVPDGNDEYGMRLERLDKTTDTWVAMDSPWYPWEDGR
jgi:hypothetical protein